MDFDEKDEEGNTLPHLYLLQNYHDVEGLEFFLEHGTRLTRNYKGHSVLHFAARYSPFILQLVGKLIEYKASFLEIDNQGSTVLHEVLKNPNVTLEVIEKLLECGAHPDFCDNTGKPPLAYCESSTLQPNEKLHAEKMFILYSIGKKVVQVDSEENLDESILCFNFVQDREKLKLWTDIRDSCISEIKKMRIVHLEKVENGEISVFDIFSSKFNEISDVEDYLEFYIDELRKNEYTNYRDILISELEVSDYEWFVKNIKWYSPNKVMLPTICVKKICSFLSKRELIYLALV